MVARFIKLAFECCLGSFGKLRCLLDLDDVVACCCCLVKHARRSLDERLDASLTVSGLD